MSRLRMLRAMHDTIEVSSELKTRIENHTDEGETIEEFLTELLNIYEAEGAFLQEGYSE